MTGVGIVLFFVGYAVLYWGVNAIQSNTQTPFVESVFPFAKSG